MRCVRSCALGGALNEKSIPELRCKVVAGAANNQLANEAEDGADWQRLGFSTPRICRECRGSDELCNELDRTPQEQALSQAEGSTQS